MVRSLLAPLLSMGTELETDLFAEASHPCFEQRLDHHLRGLDQAHLSSTPEENGGNLRVEQRSARDLLLEARVRSGQIGAVWQRRAPSELQSVLASREEVGRV